MTYLVMAWMMMSRSNPREQLGALLLGFLANGSIASNVNLMTKNSIREMMKAELIACGMMKLVRMLKRSSSSIAWTPTSLDTPSQSPATMR